MNVKRLGLSITTGRYASERSAQWTAEDVAATITKTFPRLDTIAVNLEISYESVENPIMELLQAFTAAGIRVVAFEVFLIQLPTSPRKRDARLKTICLQLRESKVVVTIAPRARPVHEVPSDGFSLPAILSLCAPAVVQRSVTAALWETVW